MRFNRVSMMALALVLSPAWTAVSAEATKIDASTASPAPSQKQSNTPGRLLGAGNRPLATAAVTQPQAEAVEHPNDGDKVKSGGRSIEFNNAQLEMVFKVYSELVNKTVLKDPATQSSPITLQPLQGQELTDEEKIEAIETVLEMNGVHLEPYGEKFVRAIPRKTVRTDGIPLIMDPNAELRESTRVVSLMLPIDNISIEEAQKALEGFKSASGVLNVFERKRAILITDTEANINRMREIARAIDVATPVMENVFVRQVHHASAADIKTALEAIVQESQKELEKNGKLPATAAAPAAGKFDRFKVGLNNNQNQAKAEPASNAAHITPNTDADRGMIRGKVLILADERSNKLIVITSKPNWEFFDKVIGELDIETTPDTVVKVYRLKYADAEDVSDMINDLIGNASSSKSSGKGNQNAAAKNSSFTRGNLTSGVMSGARKSANQRSGDAKAGELSKDNTTVLADKRINGLVVMTNKELVPVVESIIDSMDIKLSQVLIETAIIEVGLGQDIKTGIDWVKGMQRKTDRYQSALGGGGGDVRAVSAATNAIALIDGVATKLPSIFSPGGAGLNYAVFSERLDLAAVISLSQSDNTSKYIASPIIMTVDNKEAEIEATQARKFLSGYQSNSSGSYYGSSIVPQYEGKDIGIKIKVTPKINPNGTVMLEVEEEYSQVGAKQTIQDPNSKQVDIDTALTRKMSADVLLENNQTVVLGGLTDTSTATSDSGIPILKDIPWIGKYLFGRTSNSETRSELLVFLTPYVLNDAQAAQAEALRRKHSLSDQHAWDDHGWSASELADPVSEKEKMRRIQEEWKKQDEERKTRLAIEQAKLERAKKLKAMSEEERELWIKANKEQLDAEAAAKEELERQRRNSAAEEDLRKLAESILNGTSSAADQGPASTKKR